MLRAERLRDYERRALEFRLEHRLDRSHRSGQVIDERFIHLTFPSHWHYNMLRGLDHMRKCAKIRDTR